MVISSACVRCARVGAECMREATGNPRRVACDECARMKEKCMLMEGEAQCTGTRRKEEGL